MDPFPANRGSDAEFHEAEAEAAAASKRAKITEEACPNDEIMADDDDDSMSDSSSTFDEEEALDRQAIIDRFASMTNQDVLPDIDLTREYQLFLHLQGDAERAGRIACEKDADDMLSEAEKSMFWTMYNKKLWHIRRQTSDNLSDYRRLAIYFSASAWDPFYQNYARHYYLDYKFDTFYMKVADELSKCETVQWDTSYSDTSRIVEAIWETHIPSDVRSELPPYDRSELIEELIERAQERSRGRQEMKELVPLYVNLCRREVNTEEDFLLAIKEIFADQKVGDAFFYCEYLVDEALQYQEGQASSRLWYRYHSMTMSLGNVQKRQATLSDSELKDRMTNYFEGDPESESGSEYIDYVKRKIKIAKELGILQSQ